MWIITIPCTTNRMSYYKSIFEGDPPRTMKREEATVFGKKKTLEKKLKELEDEYPNRNFGFEAH